MRTWLVCALVFLAMDPTWASISSATPDKQVMATWKSSFLDPSTAEAQRQDQGQLAAALGLPMVQRALKAIRHSLIAVTENNTFREWFRWSIKGSEKIDEEDMTALEIVFLTLFVFMLFAAIMVQKHFRGHQIITVMVFGVSFALVAEMYLIAYLKGDIDENRFNLSRVVAHSPGAIFGVVIAMLWLLMPLMELVREGIPGKSAGRRRTSRFVIACLIAVLLALVTFEPELPDEATTMERVPHYVVFILALILIVIQTALIFRSVTKRKVAWFLPAIVLALICAVPPAIMLNNWLRPDNQIDQMFWLGVMQLSFILTTTICWVVAAFLGETVHPFTVHSDVKVL